MNIRLYPADSRGQADYGWLKARYSFSFAQYFNEDNVHFGVLRVLNDDIVAPGMGFGTHPHDNMEIVTIPLEGAIRHRDSMGSEGIIRFGEVQVMSAGTGVTHSEMNGSHAEVMKTLQIWIFPQFKNVAPRYDQTAFSLEQGRYTTLVTPHDKTEPGALWIYQQAYFSLGAFSGGTTASYPVKLSGNGVYLFVIEGRAVLDGRELGPRDAAGITDAGQIDLSISDDARILMIEVPMTL